MKMRFLSKTINILVPLTVAICLLACKQLPATSLLPNPKPSSEMNVIFLQQEAPKDGNQIAATALITGTLELNDGCLRLVNKQQNVDYLIIWPFDVAVETKNNFVEIQDSNGQVLVQSGQEIRLSGGEIPASESQWISTLLRDDRKLPDTCPGPYWLVGFEISPS